MELPELLQLGAFLFALVGVAVTAAVAVTTIRVSSRNLGRDIVLLRESIVSLNDCVREMRQEHEQVRLQVAKLEIRHQHLVDRFNEASGLPSGATAE
tara:strand:- start:397 stop:687 length:291 start_codon:yes stop_codon:yes gene_type:complete